ncbi:hypothetical protein AS850_02635 [Frondihabitans sp. 762G35]|uniref:hypothetical protein n=1 Tax=Frondihabitans sp. 762G35 TaxID=1446794 RepID=UPI000D20A493|nr:hypothetical protein [Frondihabitans sp. 762G35]ARC55969.1 hypothetical protein AS850_02635 [Frondihabitans sp. 762G35]
MLTRLRANARALRDASIWGRGSVSEEDDRLATLLRVYLPITYAVSAAFGWYGIWYGVPAIFDAIAPDYAAIWSQLVFATSLACLVAVHFPQKLWRVDVYANAFLVMLFSTYTVCLIYLAFFAPGDPHAGDRAALAIGSIRLILLPFWRVFDIARDREVHGWQ